MHMINFKKPKIIIIADYSIRTNSSYLVLNSWLKWYYI